MKALLALIPALALAACAGAPMQQASREAPTTAPQGYPEWLYMEPGYAEQCIADGGCIPMSKRELEAYGQKAYKAGAASRT